MKLRLISTDSGKSFAALVNNNLKEIFSDKSFLVPIKTTTFKNGEVKTEILESIRGDDIYIIADVAAEDGRSINDKLFELFVTLDAVKVSSPRRITLILPTYPYARQHKRKGREPLTAAFIARVFEGFSNIKNIVTLDIHSREIANAFQNIAFESLHASYQILKELLNYEKREDIMIVAPDSGSIERNKFFAQLLGCELAMIYKERDYNRITKDASETNITSMKLLGDVSGKTVFMFDDMIDSGGTILSAASVLHELGAKKVYIGTSLPFFTEQAPELFQAAWEKGIFEKVISTNAVYHKKLTHKDEDNNYDFKWFIQTDISKLFAEVIYKIYKDESISDLLDAKKVILENLITN